MPQKPPNPIDVHVGERVRMWRTERKVSRITLGEALGVTDQQIQKYEKGTNRIGASRLQQICSVLEIPVSFLFEGELGSSPGDRGMPQDMVDFMESEEGVRFVAAFCRPEHAARHRAAGGQDRRACRADQRGVIRDSSL
jgi:transcriptional regulator with XRE-family HTH domain